MPDMTPANGHGKPAALPHAEDVTTLVRRLETNLAEGLTSQQVVAQREKYGENGMYNKLGKLLAVRVLTRRLPPSHFVQIHRVPD